LANANDGGIRICNVNIKSIHKSGGLYIRQPISSSYYSVLPAPASSPVDYFHEENLGETYYRALLCGNNPVIEVIGDGREEGKCPAAGICM
jgi:hypothetical protein